MISGYTDIVADIRADIGDNIRIYGYRSPRVTTSFLTSDNELSGQISGQICYLPGSRPPPAAQATVQALQPVQPLLCPLGISVDHGDTPDTLASSFTHATARKCSSAARRVPKKVVAMRPAPKSWQIKDVKDTGSDMQWQSKRMAEATRTSRIH